MGIMNIGRGTVPGSDQTQMVEHQAELATYNPAVVGLAFLSHLAGTTSFPDGMNQLNAVAIDDPQQTGFSQEAVTPVLVSSQQSEETSPVGQTREHIPMVLLQPSVEGSVADAFNGMEQADGGDLAGPKLGLGMLGQLPHAVIHLAKQLSDKISGSHAILLGWFRLSDLHILGLYPHVGSRAFQLHHYRGPVLTFSGSIDQYHIACLLPCKPYKQK